MDLVSAKKRLMMVSNAECFSSMRRISRTSAAFLVSDSAVAFSISLPVAAHCGWPPPVAASATAFTRPSAKIAVWPPLSRPSTGCWALGGLRAHGPNCW